MIIRLAKRDGIRTLNIVRRRESVAELQRLGADAGIVSTDGPIDEQVRGIVGPAGVKYAIDPVVGETGTQMFKALHEEGEPIRVGDDPRYILSGRRVLEVYWLGYWLHRLEETTRQQLADDIVALIRGGILETRPGHTYSVGKIVAATTQAESMGRQGKVFLVPWQ
jgi:NADPH:quinone reductase-like Zn-dependent oxidoreductase